MLSFRCRIGLEPTYARRIVLSWRRICPRSILQKQALIGEENRKRDDLLNRMSSYLFYVKPNRMRTNLCTANMLFSIPSKEGREDQVLLASQQLQSGARN